MTPGYKKRESTSLNKTDERTEAEEVSEVGTEVCFHLCYTALSKTKPKHFPFSHVTAELNSKFHLELQGT